MSKQGQQAHHHGQGGNQGHHQNNYRQGNNASSSHQGSNNNQYQGSHHGGGQYHGGGGRGGGNYQSGSGSRNKNSMQSHRQNQNQNYQHYSGQHQQNMGGVGPQGSNQMMSGYGNFVGDNHQVSYENEGMQKGGNQMGSGQQNKNDRQDRNINSGGGYGPYQNMSQHNNMMQSSYGGQGQHNQGHQQHHNQGNYGGQPQKYNKRDRHDRNNQGGGGQHPYHKNFNNQGNYHYQGNQMHSSATPRNQMHNNFHNDFGGGQQYQDNQSEAYGDENESSSDKRFNNSNQKGVSNDSYSHQPMGGTASGNQGHANRNKGGGNYQQNQQPHEYQHNEKMGSGVYDKGKKNKQMHDGQRQDHYQMQNSDGGGKRSQNNHSMQQQQYRGMHNSDKKHNNYRGGQQNDQQMSAGSPLNSSFNGDNSQNDRNNRPRNQGAQDNHQNSYLTDRAYQDTGTDFLMGNNANSQNSMQGFGAQMGNTSYYNQGSNTVRNDYTMPNNMHGGKGSMHGGGKGGDFQQQASGNQYYGQNMYMNQRSHGNTGNSQGKHGRGGGMNHQMHQMGNQHPPPNPNKKGGQQYRFNTDQEGFHGDSKKLNQQYGNQYQLQQNPNQKGKKNKHTSQIVNSSQMYHHDSHDEHYGDNSYQHYGNDNKSSYKNNKISKHQSEVIDNRSELQFQGHDMMASAAADYSMSNTDREFQGNDASNNNKLGKQRNNESENTSQQQQHFQQTQPTQINNYFNPGAGTDNSMLGHNKMQFGVAGQHEAQQPTLQDDQQSLSSFYPNMGNKAQAQKNQFTAASNMGQTKSQAQFGNNNVFVQKNYNTQVYITDNHYYPNNLAAGQGIDPTAVDYMGLTQLQAQQHTNTTMKDLVQSTSSKGFQSIEGNREHMDETRVKEELVEIEITLINGDKEKIKITEAKDASSPLNFFDIQFQIKDRVKQLKHNLLIPTPSQRKASLEKQKEKKGGSNEKKANKEQSPRDKKQDDKSKEEQSQAVSKPLSQMTKEEKEQEKLYQDLIEALEFFVKRQLQHNLMPKYKEIAKNTHKIQFQQSIKKLQNDQFFIHLNKNHPQIGGFGGATQPNPAFQAMNPQNPLQVDQLSSQINQSLMPGQSLGPVNQTHMLPQQYQQINPNIGRAYTPVESQLAGYSLSQQNQNLTPNQISENNQDGGPTRLYDQLHMNVGHLQQQFQNQQRPQMFNGQNMMFQPDQLNNQQMDFSQINNMMMTGGQQSHTDLTDNQTNSQQQLQPSQQQQHFSSYPGLGLQSKEFHPKRSHMNYMSSTENPTIDKKE